MAILSITGLYNYDDTIFNSMCWPDDFTEDQKTETINNILMECAELEVLYPDTEFIKRAIASWSFMEKPTWNRIYIAAQAEYNPIENYRRTEEEDITSDRTEQHSGTDSATSLNTGTSTGSDGGTIAHNITGYDSNNLQLQSQDTTTGTTQSNDSQSGNSSMTHGEKIEHDDTTGRTLLAYGNIGVTTSQEMLKQEIEIAALVNVMPVIVESFKNRFCILVY